MAKLEQLICDIGNHKWTRTPTRGRKPTKCPKHRTVAIVTHRIANVSQSNKAVDTETVSMTKLHCQLGNHDWERESKRGRKPINCPVHAPVKTVVSSNPTVTTQPNGMTLLHCELGNHDWEREPKRGRLPANCPNHKTVIMTDPNQAPKRRGRPKLYETPEEQAAAQLLRSQERASNLESMLKERGTHLSQQDPYRLMKLTSVTGKGKNQTYNYQFVEEHSPLRKANFVSAHAAEFDNQQYRYERHGKVVLA
jgi:hypothetical protein